jgi:hypothetical protein
MSDTSRVIGRAPDLLTLPERAALVGRWIALEIYSPQTLPLKRIEAVGSSPSECAAELQKRGLNPREFEYVLWRG